MMTKSIKLYTIGFTRKNAEMFFSLLRMSGVRKIIDIRTNNTSQLACFAKGSDLAFFANELCHAEYLHITDMAPSRELLKDYQNKIINWVQYENAFENILNTRHIAERYPVENFDDACFLCSEDTPENCHRRLVVEYLKRMNPDKEIQIIHLK